MIKEEKKLALGWRDSRKLGGYFPKSRASAVCSGGLNCASIPDHVGSWRTPQVSGLPDHLRLAVVRTIPYGMTARPKCAICSIHFRR